MFIFKYEVGGRILPLASIPFNRYPLLVSSRTPFSLFSTRKWGIGELQYSSEVKYRSRPKIASEYSLSLWSGTPSSFKERRV